MAGQLPEGADGPAALSMIFAFVSLTCSLLLVWLTWTHDQRSSYVACIAYFAIISTTASIIQQIHVIGWWHHVMIEQFERKAADPDSADINIANGSVGMDLVLYYIQFYCYNVESMFVMFWASELAQSLYGLTEKRVLKRKLRKFNAAGKVVAILFPFVIVLCLRAPSIQNSINNFILLAGIPLFVSLGFGALLMLAILFRYVQSRRKLFRFDPLRGQSTDPESNLSGSGARTLKSSNGTARTRTKGIYDKWLMTRFSVGFVLLTIFQITSTLFQRSSADNSQRDVNAAAPDFSTARAISTLFLFLPGNAPGIALFVIFGTTTAFRAHMRRVFFFAPRQQQQVRFDSAAENTNASSGARSELMILQRPSTAPLPVEKELPRRPDSVVSARPPSVEAMGMDMGMARRSGSALSLSFCEQDEEEVLARPPPGYGHGRFGAYLSDDSTDTIPIALQDAASSRS
ncbi:hypothetical protein F4780DRAFT_624656 [Xylariomycetidae sp. FL0641]|nr:hypothetical protein F4780DRAFT_624656 [Xylariomycetidae sp. FL0641]